MKTWVKMSTEPTRTRVLVTREGRDVGRLILPPGRESGPGIRGLMEAIARIWNERVSVALHVDARSSSSDSYALLDALEEAPLLYDVVLITPPTPRERRVRSRELRLVGHERSDARFDDLRQLSLPATEVSR